MAGVYFDTTVFTSIFKPEKDRAVFVKELLRELKKKNTRVHTSIVSVQECSVTTFKRGQMLRDYHGKISELADIHTIDKDISVNAAKLEAEILQTVPPADQNKPRRKWDCFHIATARSLHCRVLYSWDDGLLKRKTQLGIDDLEFSEPKPQNLSLTFSPRPNRKKKVPQQKETLFSVTASGKQS